MGPRLTAYDLMALLVIGGLTSVSQIIQSDADQRVLEGAVVGGALWLVYRIGAARPRDPD